MELTEERERHITERHPDLYATHRPAVAETLADPCQVRRSQRDPNTRLFTRWFQTIKGGKYVVAVVVSEAGVPPRRQRARADREGVAALSTGGATRRRAT